MLAEHSLAVSVVVERRAPATQWGQTAFVPVQVLAGATDAAAWTSLGGEAGRETLLAGTIELGFFSSETPNYLANLRSGSPSLWVVLRSGDDAATPTLLTVLADPGEAEGLVAVGRDIIEPVAMPAAVIEALEAFCAAHHEERGFFKRKRDRKDGVAGGRTGDG